MFINLKCTKAIKQTIVFTHSESTNLTFRLFVFAQRPRPLPLPRPRPRTPPRPEPELELGLVSTAELELGDLAFPLASRSAAADSSAGSRSIPRFAAVCAGSSGAGLR